MVTGILILAALGAEPMPGLRLELPTLNLAQVDSPAAPVNDWPIEPRPTRPKISLIPPLVMLSIGGGLMVVSGVGIAVTDAQPCESLLCNLGPDLAFGALGLVGAVLVLAGTIWLIVDVVLNADRVDAQPSSVADSPSAPRRRGPGLVVATF